MLDDMRARFNRRSITCCIAVADTIGSAWALAHYGPDSLIIAPSGHGADAVMDLPPVLCACPKMRAICAGVWGLIALRVGGVSTASLTRRFSPIR